MKSKLQQIILLSAIFLAAFFLFSFLQKSNEAVDAEGNTVAGAEIGENYFEGKTIDWVIPFKEGGGDLFVKGS